jgi:hypothetical protein
MATLMLVSAPAWSGQKEEMKLGAYLSKARPGDAVGTLLVWAPTEFCAGPNRELSIKRYADPGLWNIARVVASRTRCEWTFPGLPAGGEYVALIREGRDGPISAWGEGDVFPDVPSRLVLGTVPDFVEGTVTINGANPSVLPFAAPLVIRIKGLNRYWPNWDAPVGPNGIYALRVGLPEASGKRVCAWLATATSLNEFQLPACGRVDSGQPLDVNVTVAPAVVRLDIPAAKTVPGNDLVVVRLQPVGLPFREGTPSAHGQSFVRTDGLRGEFFGLKYGAYDVHLCAPDAVLSTTRIVLSEEQPLADLRLTVPAEPDAPSRPNDTTSPCWRAIIIG